MSIIKTKISGEQIIGGSVTRQNLDTAIVQDIDTLKQNDATKTAQISSLQTDLAAEEGARGAADIALQGNVDAEALARAAGDENLQNQIDALETASGLGISDLESRVTAAEGDINALESGVAQEILDRQAADASTLASAKGYADQKVSDLVNSAPAVLDTLKELADALNDDPNFATTVSGQITTVQNSVNAEQTRALAAEDALSTRVGVLELLKDAQTIYVDKSGNDSTGNGSEHKPFLTIKAAMAAIADASPTKRYVLKVKAGAYTETGVVTLKPNVFVVGESKDSVRIGATSFAMDSTFNAASSFDHRSGFANVTLLNACDFNWQTVSSTAGKLYFNEVQFSSSVALYGHNNAIAQAQFHGCLFFSTFTVSGINVGVHKNNIHYGNITLNQHPNGGMATILAADGGTCSGTVTLNATTNDFNRRCSMFARSFYMEYLTVNGPSAYCDLTDNSVPRDVARVTKSNSGNIVYINTLSPIDTNTRNIGEPGKQYAYNFNYVNASTGSDLYVISMGTAYSADNSGKSIFIESDSYGLNPNVNGGDINVTTAAVSGTGVRGKIKLDAKEIDVADNKIVNVASGVNSKDAVNVSQLSAEASARAAADTTLQTNISAEASARAAGDTSTLASAKSYTDGKVADLVNSAPAVLDTLKELADALNQDPNFATTVSGQLGSIAADLSAEIARASAAEAALSSSISSLSSRVVALEAVSVITRETPSGAIDDNNVEFVLANTPVVGSEMVFLNGLLQQAGVSGDYTISGSTITFSTAPKSGYSLVVTYIKN